MRRAHAQLRAARERLLVCARDVCPPVIRDACIVSFSEVERILPTLVIRALDKDGHDVLAVRVLADGALLTDRLTGAAIALDPGPHRMRFETAEGAVHEETVLVAQGERDRLLRITFDAALRSDGRRIAPRPARAEPPPAGAGVASPSLAPIALTAGLGLASVGAFFALQLQSWSDYRALRDDPCASSGTCDVSGVRTRLVLGDVALGVGIVSLGVATVLTILRLREGAAPTSSAWTGGGTAF